MDYCKNIYNYTTLDEVEYNNIIWGKQKAVFIPANMGLQKGDKVVVKLFNDIYNDGSPVDFRITHINTSCIFEHPLNKSKFVVASIEEIK